ncbi:MAG: YgdI/YgdR family lipoprotein [Bacteroides sp.]|nr:YgdI/YgdR family lipoprotein [Bacteroides sp.]MCM1548379.1 YgdI/YgdR family lipoprotein [Clostridium sp.]
MKKRMRKKIAAVLLLGMCLALAGCGGAKDPESCKDWTEGVMAINGGIITIGKTKIDDFKATTGFDEEIKVSNYSDGSAYYYLTDGYSEITVRTESDGRITYFFASDDGFEDRYIDFEHTTITGPGGITAGSSTVEDLAEYDKNLEGRYNSSVTDEENSCGYIAGKAEGTFGMKNEYLYSVRGDLETRVIYEIMLKVDE